MTIPRDFLNEGPEGGDPDSFFPAPQQPAQAPPPQGQPQPQRFIPEDFESPQVLQARIGRRKEEARRLHAKLSKAGNTDHAQNPYAKRRQDGAYDFDQVSYDSDKRAYDAIMLDVSEANAKLSSVSSMAARLQDGVAAAARQTWKANEQRVPATIRDAVRDYYAKNVQYLIGIGHFHTDAYRTQDQVQAALAQIIATAVGTVSLSAQQEAAPASGRPANGREEPTQEPEDEFAGWEPEARRMFEAGINAGDRRRETLADRAKREAQEAQAALERRRAGGSQ